MGPGFDKALSCKAFLRSKLYGFGNDPGLSVKAAPFTGRGANKLFFSIPSEPHLLAFNTFSVIIFNVVTVETAG